jgi:hypothetical protein
MPNIIYILFLFFRINMDGKQFQIKEEKPDDEGINLEGSLEIKEEMIEEIVEKVPNIKKENFVDIIDIKTEKIDEHNSQIFSSEDIDPLLNEKEFKCETCMTFFATRKEHNLHYATFLGNCYVKLSAVHEERKMFECQFLGCESKFTSNGNLRKHISKKHTGKSFSEALILASTNPQYDKRLFIDLPVLTRKLQAQNMLFTYIVFLFLF